MLSSPGALPANISKITHTPHKTNMNFSGEPSLLSILKERVGICWACSIPGMLNHPLDVCSWRHSLLYPHNKVIPAVSFLDPSSLLAAFLGTGLNAVGDLVKTLLHYEQQVRNPPGHTEMPHLQFLK